MSEDFDFDSYPGLPAPRYTPVPDDVFDLFLPLLSGAELKVLLYICRRTFGFKRDSDDISLSQLLTGIRTADGRQLDRGTGLSKSTLLATLRSLAEKRLIIAERQESADRGHEPTRYRLRLTSEAVQFSDTPWSENRSTLGPEIDLPLGPIIDPPLGSEIDLGVDRLSIPQETGIQETDQRNRAETSKSSNRSAELDSWYPTLDKVVRDTSRALNDLGHWKSNQTHARRLVYDRSVSDSEAAKLAREVAAECGARKVGMAYFFRMLEQRLEEHTAAHPNQSLAGRYAHLVQR